MKTVIILIPLFFIITTVITLSYTADQDLKLATTTSLYDSGLWDVIKPLFEEKYNTELDIIYAGTGIALEYGRRGDVDVITVHAKSQEEQFVADGYGVERVPFAFNHFLIVGPKDDPAHLTGLTPEAAFRKLANTSTAPFISRGDHSGTHTKEQDIWESIGFDYQSIREATQWYIEAGRGMGPTLLLASEKQGYTLTDIATFLSYQRDLDLKSIINNADQITLNVYSIMAINPGKYPGINNRKAIQMIEFLTSPEIQNIIASYGLVDFGTPLFSPIAKLETTSQ